MKVPDNIKKPRGRPKGSKDKIQTRVKEAIEAAFSELGGVQYLVTMGKKEPKAFMALLGKVIPKEITGEVRVNHIQNILAELTGRTAEDSDKDQHTLQ